MIGKRKRENALLSGETNQMEAEREREAQDKLRRYFESQFEPLDVVETRIRTTTDSAVTDPGDVEVEGELVEEADESEWDGISEESEAEVEIVSYDNVVGEDGSTEYSREEFKSFMSSRAPTTLTQSTNKKSTEDSSDDEADEVANLKNDVALQQLLRESHLLDKSSGLSLSGKNRHKAIDLRLQSLGAKTSLFEQKNMPMSHRKGMVAKATQREEKRRREAKENGIVLERAVKQKKARVRRERGIGGPSVGKFKGGTLKLSRKDISDIQGPKRMRKARK